MSAIFTDQQWLHCVSLCFVAMYHNKMVGHNMGTYVLNIGHWSVTGNKSFSQRIFLLFHIKLKSYAFVPGVRFLGRYLLIPDKSIHRP